MQIKVLVFAQILDITGKRELVLDNIRTTDELNGQLHILYPTLSKLPYRIAVDKEIITKNTSLDDHSIVALLPPFSGG